MRVGYVLERFPSLYQTYVLDEMLELERLGFQLVVYAMGTSPRGAAVHERVAALQAPVIVAPSFRRSPFSYLKGAQSWFRHPQAALPRLAKSALGPRRRTAIQSLLRAAYLASSARQQGIGHFHAHFATGANVVAWQLGQLLDRPFSFTVHAADLFARPVLLCESLRASRFVVTVSQYHREFISHVCGGSSNGKVQVIHAGIRPGAFRTERPARSGHPRLLTVGRLVKKKGHRYLIEALAQLGAEGYDFEGVIVGEGPERSHLALLIDRLGLAGRIHLLGALPSDQVRDLYASSDIFVLPCVVARDGDRDGIPVSLMEAMASGLPVVSTPVSGIPELVTEDVGRLVPPRDVGTLAEALRDLMKSPDLREALGRRGQAAVEAGFDVRANSERLAALFERGSEK